MVANSLQDVYSLLYGWHIYGRLWSILEESGLIFVPFIFALINISVEARNSGADEGNAGFLSVKRLETKFLSLIIVLLVVCVPFKHGGFSANVRTVDFHQNINECRPLIGKVAAQELKENLADRMEALVGREYVYMPIFWGFLNSLSTALVSASIKALPCSDSIAFASYQFNQEVINDRKLLDALEEFYEDCYKSARWEYSQLKYNSPDLTGEEDLSWIGNKTFLEHPELYNQIRFEPMDITKWPVDNRFKDTQRPFRKFISCKTYWSAPGIGLADRVFNSVEPDIRTNAAMFLYEIFGEDEASANAKKDFIIENVLSTTQASQTNLKLDPRYVYMDSNGENAGLRDLVPTAILFFKSFGKDVEKYVVRKSQDYILSLVTLFFLICLPFVLLLGGFSWKIVAMTGVAFFAIEMINFIFAVAYWAENVYITDLARYNILSMDTRFILDILSTLMYVGFPLLWLVLVGWAGFNVQQGLSGLFNSSNAVATQAGSSAESAAKSAVTKGASGAKGSGGGQGSLNL